MEAEQPVLDSLRRAVEAMPDDVPLRTHLATMLMSAGLREEAIRQVGAILQRDPGNAAALALLPGQQVTGQQSRAPAKPENPAAGLGLLLADAIAGSKDQAAPLRQGRARPYDVSEARRLNSSRYSRASSRPGISSGKLRSAIDRKLPLRNCCTVAA
jgi:predicted Zn-dependent protease